MVDGGILSNYPIWIFDSPTTPRWPTFGFHFVKDEIQADPATITSLFPCSKDYLKQ